MKIHDKILNFCKTQSFRIKQEDIVMIFSYFEMFKDMDHPIKGPILEDIGNSLIQNYNPTTINNNKKFQHDLLSA